MTTPPPTHARWTVSADIAHVGPCVREVATFLEGHGIAGKPLFTAQLVLEELLANAVRHACVGGAARVVDVRVDLDRADVRITVEDDGGPFDPLHDAPVFAVDAPLEARHAGGMGLHLVRSLVDDWAYERDGPTNRVRLRVSAAAA